MTYWKDLKEGEIVKEINGAFYSIRYTTSQGKLADLIYWNDHDQPQAQQTLIKRASQSQTMEG